MCDYASTPRWDATIDKTTAREDGFGRSIGRKYGINFGLMQYKGRTRGKVGRTAVGVSDLLVRVQIFDMCPSVRHRGRASFHGSR